MKFKPITELLTSPKIYKQTGRELRSAWIFQSDQRKFDWTIQTNLFTVSLSALIDLGSQGFDSGTTTAATQYYFFGNGLQWNIFAGDRSRHRKKQAETGPGHHSSQRDNVAEHLLLQAKGQHQLISKLA